MYIKKCIYCGKEFESTHPNAKHCSKYHAAKAREIRYKVKKYKVIRSWTTEPDCLVDIKYIFKAFVYDEIKNILEKY
ncbi:MAG: hypothetical protein ACRCW0_06775 [Clostridium sp.]